MNWYKWAGKILKIDGKIAIAEECCCPECDEGCEFERDALGLPPLPDTLIWEWEYLEGPSPACDGVTNTNDMIRTTGVEWLDLDDGVGHDGIVIHLRGCSADIFGSEWVVDVWFGGVIGQGYNAYPVTVNCAATSGQALVDWTTLEDIGPWFCSPPGGGPPYYTFRFRILLP